MYMDTFNHGNNSIGTINIVIKKSIIVSTLVTFLLVQYCKSN